MKQPLLFFAMIFFASCSTKYEEKELKECATTIASVQTQYYAPHGIEFSPKTVYKRGEHKFRVEGVVVITRDSTEVWHSIVTWNGKEPQSRVNWIVEEIEIGGRKVAHPNDIPAQYAQAQ